MARHGRSLGQIGRDSRRREVKVLSFLRRRIEDDPGIPERRLAARPFIAGEGPAAADLSMIGALMFPQHAAG